MDTKIIQLLISGIIDTGEYTLEGIAYSTHIPYDVVYDAACGVENRLSISTWARIVELYLQLKPDLTDILIEKLRQAKDQYAAPVSLLLNTV